MDDYIIYAASQGTTTALNHAAKRPENLKGLILESSMVSPNSAICHTVGAPAGTTYCLPYLAKLLFWSYSPTGEKPIDALDEIDKTIPIYIMHNARDPQVPYSNGAALYACLKQMGHKNVYLSKSGDEGGFGFGKHLHLRDQKDKENIQSMFLYKLPIEQKNENDLKQEGEKHYEKLVRDERNTKIFGYVSLAAIVTYLGCRYRSALNPANWSFRLPSVWPFAQTLNDA